jgi:hypothetical protein
MNNGIAENLRVTATQTDRFAGMVGAGMTGY